MLNDDDRVSLVYQAVQHFEQQPDVLEVEASRRFVQDIEGAPGVSLGELGREFDALCFAARQRRRGLAEMEISEADIVQQVELFGDAALG